MARGDTSHKLRNLSLEVRRDKVRVHVTSDSTIEDGSGRKHGMGSAAPVMEFTKQELRAMTVGALIQAVAGNFKAKLNVPASDSISTEFDGDTPAPAPPPAPPGPPQ